MYEIRKLNKEEVSRLIGVYIPRENDSTKYIKMNTGMVLKLAPRIVDLKDTVSREIDAIVNKFESSNFLIDARVKEHKEIPTNLSDYLVNLKDRRITTFKIIMIIYDRDLDAFRYMFGLGDETSNRFCSVYIKSSDCLYENKEDAIAVLKDIIENHFGALNDIMAINEKRKQLDILDSILK